MRREERAGGRGEEVGERRELSGERERERERTDGYEHQWTHKIRMKVCGSFALANSF